MLPPPAHKFFRDTSKPLARCTVVPAILSTLIQPAKYGHKLKVVLKLRAVYTENIQVALKCRELLEGS